MHYVILLVTTADIPVQEVKQSLATFNQTYFSLQRFNVNSFYVNNTQQMITIAKFNNADQAMNYYNILVKDEAFKSNITKKTITPYAISAKNYTSFYNNKEGRIFYDDFFKEHYIKE